MRDYKLGKIYKLHILDDENLIYYGSTIQNLSVRLAGHKAQYKRYKEGMIKNYYSSFKLLETEKYVIITLVEKYPCASKYELEARERFYIENNNCVNKYIPTRTLKEYRKKNADKIKKQMKEYRKANADKIAKQNKEYREANKDKIKEWREANADKHKKYMKEYNKKYYKANIDKYKEN